MTPALDTDFKRIFPLSNGSMLAPLDLWLSRLFNARFRVGLVYVPRLIAILIFSAANTLLTLPERLLVPLLLSRRRVKDPVFVLGVHRSGTTHLQNLLALDPQFSTPRTYQIINPVGCLFSGWLVTPLWGAFMPWQRPMDNVRFNIFTPQEEEFAIAGVCPLSPYWAITFPRQWTLYDRYLFPDQLAPRETRKWKRHYVQFLKKVTFWSGKRPMLKNPYNTGRVAILHEMFPRARFIHISRHPYNVYRSNMHLAREGHVVSQLQNQPENDSYQARFLDNYRAMEDAFYHGARSLESGQVSEAKFEDIVQDPMGEIQRIYRELGLEFTDAYRQRLEQYLAGIAGYRQNRYTELLEEQRAMINEKIGPYMEQWGYADRPASDVSTEKAA